MSELMWKRRLGEVEDVALLDGDALFVPEVEPGGVLCNLARLRGPRLQAA